MSHSSAQISKNSPVYYLVASALTLSFFGFLSISSTTILKEHLSSSLNSVFLSKQILAFMFIPILFYSVYKIPFIWIEKITVPLIIISLLLLSLIFVPNAFKKVGGAARWLNAFGVRFQPTELAKLAVIFFLAKFLTVHSLSRFILSLTLPLVFCLFIIKQPDLGSCVVLMVLTMCMLYVADYPLLYIGSCFGVLLLGIIAAILYAPYRLKRVVSFLDPWSTFHLGGFQLIQSFLAFNNGGLLGLGLGESKQKLAFLPEAHTDFIFSVIGEEFGYLGTVVICSLFCVVVISSFVITIQQKTNYKKHLAFGLSCLIALQALLNMFVTMGLLPTKGIPLPFISSGLSSLLVFYFSICLIAKIGISTHDDNRDEFTIT